MKKTDLIGKRVKVVSRMQGTDTGVVGIVTGIHGSGRFFVKTVSGQVWMLPIEMLKVTKK